VPETTGVWAVRVLAPMVEAALSLLRLIWRGWRQQLWERAPPKRHGSGPADATDHFP